MNVGALKKIGFEVEFHSHAEAILRHDFPDAWGELEALLQDFTIPIEEIIGSGGGEAKGTQRLRRSLTETGWTKLNFVVEKVINGERRESTSHEVDHVKRFDSSGGSQTVALEIEWNNKDPFFDRDLENFKRLHSDGAISVGFIITRGTSLQNSLPQLVRRFVDENGINDFDELTKYDYVPTPKQRREIERRIAKRGMDFRTAFVGKFVSDKFGSATTHWMKLQDRVHRGVGYPCPIGLIGLPASIVTFDA